MRHAQLSIRITFGLLAIAVSVLLMAVLLGLVSPGSLSEQAWFGSARDPRLSLFLFYATALFAAFYCYLSRSLQTWDPARAVPARVQSALDTLSDGVIVLDEFECLVLVNASFAQLHGKPAAELVGLPASLFAWTLPNNSHELLPWQHSLRTGEECHDRRIGLKMNPAEPRIFRVNSTPLRDEQGRLAGAMATFVDVTTMERGRQALCDILRELSDSRDDIKRQNQELQVLATFDPLTNCLNRRAFFEKFETHWKNADRYKVPLTCLMVDLDHFKSINDRFGHPAGDQVLQRVGQVLLQTARDSDLVCRYGGEEFCVLMPHTNLEQGTLAARRIHTAIAEVDFGAFQVTASIGLAERDLQHRQPHDLLNEADRCLY
jgi:diguanylate cyclase (GGDEF)-like protein/PAS domain S-box-containing protein